MLNKKHLSTTDTEGKSTLNCYSRGHLFYVQPTGIIRYWQPLYKSESTSQVAVTTIKFCVLFVKTLCITVLSNIFLFYDNMCNLERMKLWTSGWNFGQAIKENWLRKQDLEYQYLTGSTRVLMPYTSKTTWDIHAETNIQKWSKNYGKPLKTQTQRPQNRLLYG